MDKLFVIKIGGNIIDSPDLLEAFLSRFAALKGNKILVHGGGKLATKLAEQLQIPQQLVDGRRITDEHTLRVVTMVYAGLINKEIVARLQARGCSALGLSGADGDLIRAHKRVSSIDYGYVGDIDHVNSQLIDYFFNQQDSLVVAPITHDGNGQLLNTNADTIARELAIAMSAVYETVLIYCFEKNGVLRKPEDETTVIPVITPSVYQDLLQEKENNQPVISAGMLPKLDNAFNALKAGVHKVMIGKSEALEELIAGFAGTTIQHD